MGTTVLLLFTGKISYLHNLKGSALHCTIHTYTFLHYIAIMSFLSFLPRFWMRAELFPPGEGYAPSFANQSSRPAHLLLQCCPQPIPLIPPLLYALAYQRILLHSEGALVHLTLLYRLVLSMTVLWCSTQLLAYGLPVSALCLPPLAPLLGGQMHQLQQALLLSYTIK